MRLTKEQEQAKLGIAHALADYKDSLAQLDSWYAAQREILKDPVRLAVAKAEELEVPVRQIHNAAGYAHPSGLAHFLRIQAPKGTGFNTATFQGTVGTFVPVAATPEPPKRERIGPVQVESTDDDDFSYMVTDTFGEQFEISIAFGGKDRPDNGFAEDVEGREDSEEIKAALEKARGKTIIWD